MSTTSDLVSHQRSRLPGRRRLAGVLVTLTLVSAMGVATGAQPAFGATTYYVDGVNGADTNSGTAAVPGPGSVGPYKSIQKCADQAGPGDVCSIRGGTYREKVTPRSGTAGSPVTFRAHNDEPVTVTGLNRVTSSWTQHSGSIYKTTVTLPVNGYADSGFLANQLFVEGAPMLEARSPNTGTDLVRNQTRLTADADSDADTLVDAELPSIPGGWAGGRVYFRVSKKYTSSSAKITSATATSLELDTSTINTSAATCPFSCMGPNALYFLYGKLGALDTANEWFYDGDSKTLYAWAPGGATPRGIEYKARTDAFDLKGKSNVNVTGLRLKAATVSTDATSSGNVLDRLDVQYVSHFMTVPFNSARPFGGIYDDAHMRDTGIILHGTKNTLKNSIVAHSAGNGVSLDGSGHVVDNNVIHDVNYGGTYSAGVVAIGGSSGMKITRNTIYNTGRDGISMAVNLKADPQTWKDNEVGYNEIFDVGLLNADLGAVYICCSIDMTGTRFHHNLLHTRNNNGARAFYFDAGSGNATVDHNILPDGGVTLNATNSEQGGGVNRGNVGIHNNYLGFVWSNKDYTAASDVKNNIFRNYLPTSGTVGGTASNNLPKATDPKVVDPLSYNFELKAGSPAIDAGTVVAGITDGFTGSAPDIGPYEFGQSWRAGATFFNSNENLARSALVTASSTYGSGNAAVKANDGDSATRWNAGATLNSNQWLQYDFGAVRTVNRVVVQEALGRVTSHKLQYWSGSAWVDVESGGTLGNKTFMFTPVSTSKVRLLVVAATDSPSLTETSVYQQEVITHPLLTVTGKGSSRNDFTGRVGVKFTTKGSPVEVTELGRHVVTGNAGVHTLELIRTVDKAVVASGRLDLSTARSRPDGFAYAKLAAPAVLAPYTSYYVASSETSGGDRFHDTHGTSATAGDMVTLNSSVYYDTAWREVSGSGYGPVTLTFQPFRAADARPVLTITGTGSSRNNYTGKVGAKITTGSEFTVSQLGRRKGLGTGVHTLSLVKGSDGTEVASVRLDLSAATAPAEDGIVYAPLTTPVTLAANTAYHLVSTETSGGDPFHDVFGTSASSDRVSVDSGVYGSGTSLTAAGSTGALYGPVNLK